MKRGIYYSLERLGLHFRYTIYIYACYIPVTTGKSIINDQTDN